MKQIHEDPAVKAAQATLDKVQQALQDVQEERRLVSSRMHASGRAGAASDPATPSDAIARLLEGRSESDGQILQRLDAREAEITQAAALAQLQLDESLANAAQTLRRELEPQSIELRKQTLAAMRGLVDALDAEDKHLRKLQAANVLVHGDTVTWLGHMYGGLTGNDLRHLLQEQSKELERREVASGVATAETIRVSLLADTFVEGEWFQVGSVLNLPHRTGMLLVLDGSAEKTTKSEHAMRGKSSAGQSLPTEKVWS